MYIFVVIRHCKCTLWSLVMLSFHTLSHNNKADKIVLYSQQVVDIYEQQLCTILPIAFNCLYSAV